MKLATIIEGVQDSLAARLEQLRPAMAAAAQAIYDSWDPEFDEYGDAEVGGGGICDQIANGIGEILSDAGVDYTEGGQEGDDHAYLIAYDDQNAYSVDIPYRHYESGGGMSWSKHPDVSFTPDMVEIAETWRPDWIEDEYVGLEDNDEFGELTKGDIARAMHHEVVDLPVQPVDPEDLRGIPRLESYEGLEDADEFDDQTDFCDGCGRDYSHEDLEDCNCGGIWCDYCVSSGSNFDWVPEFMENGREHPDAGQMIACPRCMTDDYVSPYPADQYTPGTLEHSGESPWHPRPPIPPHYVKESYEGLEDADEFAPNSCVICGGDNGDWGMIFDQQCAICGDPICDECAALIKRQDSPLADSQDARCSDCGQPICPACDTREGPGFEITCPSCLERRDEQAIEQAYEDAWLGESYEGLEDADEFRDPNSCMYCGAQMNLHNGNYIYDCINCDAKTCENCLDKHDWSYDYAIDTGGVAICPDCQNR